MQFYRNLFALLCFLFFAFALGTGSPHAYWGALMCGCLSRAAVRKKWPDPPFAKKLQARVEELPFFGRPSEAPEGFDLLKRREL
ncbi:MAG TPA: hypothetical protein PK364_10250 [Synergistaceae bacterium]|nr:hypothetical protein [Synergistaceae bacterium]HPJ26662.1 hypothetical protein [Synergistaceae bacterium]HPQ37367.1 hypothetical protein [Synergistaceae bacterium]